MAMTEEQIKHMAERFLGWKLPENFNPDGGISFTPLANAGMGEYEYRHQPTGTNVLDYTQAEAMVRHLVEGLPDGVADEVSKMQEGWSHPIHMVAFRAGFLLCREYMARFVESGGDPNIATSIRANWLPQLGEDPKKLRRLRFDECVAADDLDQGPWAAKDPPLASEAACYALAAACDMKLALATDILAAETDSTS